MFLRPQHFQQQDRHTDDLIHGVTAHLRPYPWGVAKLEIDPSLLSQGAFGLRRVEGVMEDGTPFALPAGGRSPPQVDIPREAGDTIIYLTLPRRADGPQFSRNESTRYIVRDRDAADAFSVDVRDESIEVAHPNIRLALEKEPGRTNLGVARVQEVLDGRVVLDSAYIPPCLDIRATLLKAELDNLVARARRQIVDLSESAVSNVQAGRDAITSFLMLQALNRWTATLEHLSDVPGVHPERLHEAFAGMLGDLATVADPMRYALRLPRYDHENLDKNFWPLLRRLQALVSEMVNPTAGPWGLRVIEPGHYGAMITDHQSIARDDHYLAVNARGMPIDEIARHARGAIKIAASNQINNIVRNGLHGIPFEYESRPPPQINPLRGWAYFKLIKTELHDPRTKSRDWSDLETANGVGVHVSGRWDELKLELWWVKEDGR